MIYLKSHQDLLRHYVPLFFCKAEPHLVLNQELPMKNPFESELFLSIREFFLKINDKTQNISILNRTPSKKLVIALFGAVIGLLVCVSAVFIFSESRENREQTTAAQTDTADLAAYSAQQDEEITGDFLLALTDNERASVQSVVVVRFNTAQKSLIFSFVDPDETATVNEAEADMHTHLKNGGTNGLLWAVSEYTGMNFDRYLISDEDSFSSFVASLGDMTVEIEDRVSFDHNGISFIIDKGEQTLTADMMLKYYLYLISSPNKNGDRIAQMLVTFFEELLSEEDDTKREEAFCSAVGIFDTNLSAIDYSNHKNILRTVPELKLGDILTIEEDATGLGVPHIVN